MNGFEVEVFFDGDCPLCVREMRVLSTLDRAGRVQFTDIAATGFDVDGLGIVHAALMESIHGRLPDGTWVEGVEVFRRLYSAVGLGFLMAPTRLPGISHLADFTYKVFARNRLRMTGRCNDGACDMSVSDRGQR